MAQQNTSFEFEKQQFPKKTDFSKFKTGQDLIDAGIKPKTTSEMMALISLERLKALRDKIRSDLTVDMLGEWKPLYSSAQQSLSDFENAEAIKDKLFVGMTVTGVGSVDRRNNLEGLEGTIKSLGSNIGVEWNKRLPDGHTLNNLVQNGYGLNVEPKNIRVNDPLNQYGSILVPGKIDPTVVADPKIGHKIRFSGYPDENYNVKFANQESTYLDGSEVSFPLPTGTIATLTKINKKQPESIDIKLDEPVKGQGRTQNYRIFFAQNAGLKNYIQASSLGTEEPKDEEEEIRNKTIVDFFPKTVHSPEKAERILTAMIMGADIGFHGPPSGGKSSTGKDMIAIRKHQDVIFTVPGCQSQCNPFSLFDPKFSKKIDACPECKIEYDPNFKDTNIFNPPKPDHVKVIAKKFGDGTGIEMIEGTSNFNRTHLAGYKIPKLDGTTDDKRESDFDPTGFKAGVGIRTNNGVLVVEEMDKLKQSTLDDFLTFLEDEMIKPDQLRFMYPADSVLQGTANDITKLSEAMMDRMLWISIRHPTDAQTNHGIRTKGYHKLYDPAESISLDNLHFLEGNHFRKLPMAEPVERAVDALYMKFRAEYNGAGKSEITASNRSKFDALDAARAQWLMDSLFFKDTPSIVNDTYAEDGISYAFCGRVHIQDQLENHAAKEALSGWVKTNFQDALKSEENAWWCEFNKYLSITARAAEMPELISNFNKEMQSYEWDDSKKTGNVMPAFNSVKKALSNPANRSAQKALIEYPFMSYLFKNQPHFDKLDQESQVTGLMAYYSTSKNGCLVDFG